MEYGAYSENSFCIFKSLEQANEMCQLWNCHIIVDETGEWINKPESVEEQERILRESGAERFGNKIIFYDFSKRERSSVIRNIKWTLIRQLLKDAKASIANATSKEDAKCKLAMTEEKVKDEINTIIKSFFDNQMEETDKLDLPEE